MPRPAVQTGDADEARRRRLLDAGLATFMRYGYRKTSMEEVARAAGISRQGLYLHFATKEELFRAVVRHYLTTGLEGVHARVAEHAQSVEARLVGAFDEWLGRFIGMLGADVTDLHEATDQLVGPMIAEHEEKFVDTITKVIRGSKLPGAYKRAGVSARQLADTLNATAIGLKHACSSRRDFAERMGIAVRALCAIGDASES
ncbi:MAG: TetR/AcrR family transcriptional regulator [Kofleriaceae bacterium]|nr:TetR/AcrR family transcriptional regulator [Kofleriaceae bacterium]